MMLTASNKMASSRNLSWSRIQGGHGSHENQCSQKSFVLSREFLESRYQTAENLSFDLPRWSALACEISFDPRNRFGVRPGEYRRSSPVYDSIFEENPETSERKSSADCYNLYREKHAPDPRRCSLSEEGKKDRRTRHSSRSRRFYSGTLCCDKHSQDRKPAFLLGNPGIPPQGNLQELYWKVVAGAGLPQQGFESVGREIKRAYPFSVVIEY